MKKRSSFVSIFLLCMVSSFAICSQQESVTSSSWFGDYIDRRNQNSFVTCSAKEIFKDIAWSVICLNLNIFSWDSLKIVSTAFPFYIAARMADEKLHACFYTRDGHKNKHQVPYWARETARMATGPLIAFLGLEAFLSRDDEFRTANQIMLLGLPFVLFANQIIKKFKFEACWRPWNGNFSCEKRASGGFPSGHTAQITYMTALYGLRYGPKAAIPLSLLATFVGTIFVATNRHYFSQVVAGAAMGLLYGFAADKVISSKLSSCMAIDVFVDDHARPNIGVSYRF